MAEIDLDKLPPELRDALAKATAPKPERRDTIGVSFTYDPDDEGSVKRGYERGHLTADDLKEWGYDLVKLGLAKPEGEGGDGGDGGEGGDKGGRRPYFPKATS